MDSVHPSPPTTELVFRCDAGAPYVDVILHFPNAGYRVTDWGNLIHEDQTAIIANIQDPQFMLVAVKADSGITDLHQILEKKLPVRIMASGTGGLADVSPQTLAPR